MKRIIALGLALCSPAALTGEAQAAACGPHEKIADVLGQKFQENRSALGLAGESSIIELFVSEAGTWTLTTTDTRGLTCVIGSGEAWQATPVQPAGLNS